MARKPLGPEADHIGREGLSLTGKIYRGFEAAVILLLNDALPEAEYAVGRLEVKDEGDIEGRIERVSLENELAGRRFYVHFPSGDPFELRLEDLATNVATGRTQVFSSDDERQALTIFCG